MWPQFVYNPKGKDSLYWVRLDMTRKMFMAGCDQKLKDTIKHSFEILHCWEKDFKGVLGQPLALRAGVNYELSDQTEFSVNASFDSAYTVSTDVEHKIDKHWTVSASQDFESDKVGSKAGPYHVGFAASYKL